MTAAFTVSPPGVHVLPPPPRAGGYTLRASEHVRKQLDPDEPMRWEFHPDDYIHAEILSVGESRHGQKKVKTLICSVLEGTEQADPITPQAQRSIPLAYTALEPLGELQPGARLVLHFKGRRGWMNVFRYSIAANTRPGEQF